MILQGQRRLLILVTTESAFWSSIATLVLSCLVSEILQNFVHRKPIFHTPPLFRSIFSGCFLSSRSVIIRDAGVCRERTPRLSSSKIIFEDYYNLLARSHLNVTDGPTIQGPTIAIPRNPIALCVASRGKKMRDVNAETLIMLIRLLAGSKTRFHIYNTSLSFFLFFIYSVCFFAFVYMQA